jgi:phage-related protein
MFRILYFTSASGRSHVEDFINEQPRQARDKCFEVISFLETHGFHLSTNYLRRMSGSHKLWELRIQYQSRKYRIFLARVEDRTIIFLHSIIKKTQKTPQQDIWTAEERLRMYEKGAV